MAAVENSHLKGSTERPLIERTLAQSLDESCKKGGISEAIVFVADNFGIAFAQLRQQADQYAACLLGIGLNPGDHVALWGANHAQLILGIYACIKAGFIFSNLNHALAADELERQLKLIEAKAVICFPSVKAGHCYNLLKIFCPEFDESKPGGLKSARLPKLSHVIIADNEAYLGTFKLADILANPPPEFLAKIPEIAAKQKPHDLASIQFTAGTTGDPKAVMLTHFQLINSCDQIGRRMYLDKLGEILCCPMPVYRAPILCLAALAPIVLAAKVVFPSVLPVPVSVFKAIQEQKCTALVSHPIAFQIMLRMPQVKNFNLTSLTSVCIAGEHVPRKLVGLMQASTAITDVTVGMFFTECGCMPIYFPSEGDPQKVVRTAGTIGEHFEAKVLELNGNKICDLRKPGELYIKPIGGSKFLGYFNDPEATANATKEEGWIATGDVGMVDRQGYVTLMGKVTDVIHQKSGPVFPSKIEHEMTDHPAVVGVQIVGIPDPEKGNKLCACVVPKNRENLDENLLRKDILGTCKKEQIEEPDVIVFVKDFPRTPARRVQKFKLKEMAMELVTKLK